MDHIDIHGIITIHEIPEWTDEELAYWWTPECGWIDGKWGVIRPARISDEAKAQRMVKEPVHNLLTNTGMTLCMANNSVATQANQWPFAQILSVGNGSFTGATRNVNAVSGDAFGTNCRKAPASNSTIGFQSTIVFNYASGDAQGTWTNLGLYGRNTATAQDASTTAGTGALMTIAGYPFVKGATAYAVNYVLSLSN